MDALQEKRKKVTAKLFLGMLYATAGFAGLIGLTYTLNVAVSTPLAVFLIGGVGGFVSIHRRLLTMDEVTLEFYASSLINLCISPLVGGILAVVLYFLFLSEIVSSVVFPHFVSDTPLHSNGTMMDMLRSSGETFVEWGKLAFWSFVAGYSEDFVLAVIDSVKTAAIDKVRGAKPPHLPAQQGASPRLRVRSRRRPGPLRPSARS